MSGIPDRRWDDIQRGRDPDSLSWERERDEDFQRTQWKIEQEIDRWKLDLERNRIVQDTADANPVSPPCRRERTLCSVEGSSSIE
jgi:hypothetical protein